MAVIILSVEVHLDLNGEKLHNIAAEFESRVNDLLEEGAITGGTEAEVNARTINVVFTE